MTFPKARGRGYNVDEVEDFLDEARRAYSGGDQAPTINAESIRRASFSVKRGGYSVNHVDDALDRLEDAFATKEQVRGVIGETSTGVSQTRELAQEIVNRLARPKRHRFDRAGFLVDGYHRGDVDALADRIFAHFVDGAALESGEVRTAAFRPKRGGYSEAQVDFLLDAVVGVMLAVR